MPVPKLNMPKIPKTSEEKIKRDIIFRKLYDMHYNVLNERNAIRIIEEYNIDKTQFDWPYGSFEAFKQHVLAGDFDRKITTEITKEQHDQFKKDVEEGRSWVMY